MSDYVVLVDEHGTPYLAHHGIKGQKWGVRRFQNPDGTWTADGRVRYAKQEYKSAQKELRKANSLKKSFGMSMVNNRSKANDAREKAEVAFDAYRKARSDRAREKHGEKGEYREHVRQMRKAGAPGSAADTANNNRSSRLYDRLSAERGKDYADKVSKSVLAQNYALLATGVALTGMGIAAEYALDKYY